MTLEQRFRLLVYLQVLVGILAFCMARQDPGLMLVVGAVASASWYVTEGPRARFLPRWLVNLGSVVAMGWLGMSALVRHEALPVAMGQFIMVLQVLMLYARKTSREYSMVLVLSLLQIVGASVLSVSLLYGVFLLAYCGLSLVTLMLLHLKATGDWVAEQRRLAAPTAAMSMLPGTAAGTVPGGLPGGRSPTLGRLARRDFGRSWALIGVVTLVTAVLAFVAIPRSVMMNTPSLENLTDARQRTTAFAETVDLTGRAPQEGSTASIMHLAIERPGSPGGGEGEPWLLRGAVLDHYDPQAKTWTRSTHQSRQDLYIDAQTLRERPLLPNELRREGTIASITYRDTTSRILFVPVQEDTPLWSLASVDCSAAMGISIGSGDGQASFTDHRSPSWTYRLSFANADPLTVQESYRRLGAMQAPASDNGSQRTGWRSRRDGWRWQAETPAGYDPLDRAQRWARDLTNLRPRRVERLLQDTEAYTLDLPPQALLIRQFALQTLRDARIEPPGPDSTPAERRRAVQALSDHLRLQFAYSDANPAPAPGQDPITTFLYEQQLGHCELFASALTLMCRSVGLPARVITGYRASEFNTIGRYYVVRQSHAHAWAEVDLGAGLGWHTFDPTPADQVNRDHDTLRTWAPLAWLQDMYEHLEYSWLSSVIAYDHRTRQAVFHSVGNQFQLPDPNGTGWASNVVRWTRDTYARLTLDPVLSVAVGGVLLALAVALGSLALQLARRRRRLQQLQLTHLPRPRSRKLAKHLRFYLYMLELLERHGHRRPPWQTPGDFARELADAHPLKFDPVVALTDLFYQVRFGHADLDPTHRERIDAHLRQLERGLAEKTIP